MVHFIVSCCTCCRKQISGCMWHAALDHAIIHSQDGPMHVYVISKGPVHKFFFNNEKNVQCICIHFLSWAIPITQDISAATRIGATLTTLMAAPKAYKFSKPHGTEARLEVLGAPCSQFLATKAQTDIYLNILVIFENNSLIICPFKHYRLQFSTPFVVYFHYSMSKAVKNNQVHAPVMHRSYLMLYHSWFL